MFSSRTLEERNNDPMPWEQVYSSETYAPFSRRAWGGSGAAFNPRPEFQHGVIPANPILVRLRVFEGKTMHGFARDEFLKSLVGPNSWQWGEVATRSQLTHAIHFLTLLSSLTPTEGNK